MVQQIEEMLFFYINHYYQDIVYMTALLIDQQPISKAVKAQGLQSQGQTSSLVWLLGCTKQSRVWLVMKQQLRQAKLQCQERNYYQVTNQTLDRWQPNNHTKDDVCPYTRCIIQLMTYLVLMLLLLLNPLLNRQLSNIIDDDVHNKGVRCQCI